MLFNSLIFILLFLPVTYGVFWSLKSSFARYVWLTVTGYVFYGYWDPRFCLLMLFSTLVSYLAGLALLRSQSPASRRWSAVIPITVDLLILGFFKYADFVLASLDDVLRFANVGQMPLRLNIPLPIGISFYTFHTISYIIDSYRGAVKPTRNFFEFAAYVSLFSQLVAGPIVRFRQIEEDLERIGAADRLKWFGIGVSFFVFGLTEKVLVADYLADMANPLWQSPGDLSTTGAWIAALAYTFQLYFDFSGYSTMAVGLGYLFGIRIPQNFNSPYQATNPSDFWRRWHISLSTCMRDYLYFPLGGNRLGPFRTNVNLMLTMLIGGLWHGANWTFVVWGLYHGLLLMAYRATAATWDRVPLSLQRIATFALVLIGWVFFRAESLPDAFEMLSRLFLPTDGAGVDLLPRAIPALAIAALWSMAGPNAFDWHQGDRWRRAWPYLVAFVFGICFSIILSGRNSPFLYFQF